MKPGGREPQPSNPRLTPDFNHYGNDPAPEHRYLIGDNVAQSVHFLGG